MPRNPAGLFFSKNLFFLKIYFLDLKTNQIIINVRKIYNFKNTLCISSILFVV